MKFLSSKVFAEYGHVLLPGLAGVIGLAALTSQWIENHRLRAELVKKDSDRVADVQSANDRRATGVNDDKGQRQAAELNKWVDALNQSIAAMNQRAAKSKQERLDLRNQEHGREVAITNQSGGAAGVQWRGTTRDVLMEEAIRGNAPAGGLFQGKVFRAKGVALSEMPEIARFIRFSPDVGLTFDPSGSQPGLAGAGEPTTPMLDPSEEVPLVPKLPES